MNTTESLLYACLYATQVKVILISEKNPVTNAELVHRLKELRSKGERRVLLRYTSAAEAEGEAEESSGQRFCRIVKGQCVFRISRVLRFQKNITLS